MPEVIFTGPAGRLEGRYQPSKEKSAPIAIVLHPHPQFGGTMNNQIVYELFYMFESAISPRCASISAASAAARASSTTAPANCRTRPRRSTGCRRSIRSRALLGRRLFLRLLDRHAAPDAPARDRRLHLDRAAGQPLRFLVPGALPVVGPDHPWRCRQGGAAEGCRALVDKLHTQKGITIDQKTLPGANHFFEAKVEPLMES